MAEIKIDLNKLKECQDYIKYVDSSKHFKLYKDGHEIEFDKDDYEKFHMTGLSNRDYFNVAELKGNRLLKIEWG